MLPMLSSFYHGTSLAHRDMFTLVLCETNQQKPKRNLSCLNSICVCCEYLSLLSQPISPYLQ